MSVERVGVVGAGTMGAGIAQIAALGGYETRLHDPVPAALATGIERLRSALVKGAAKGLWTEGDADAASGRVGAATSLGDLGECDLVVEAAPENLTLKRELFAALAEACGPQAILASNTSSLPVTAIATEVPRPERVVGMHFFNPPALMKLVEVVATEDSSEDALEATTEVGHRMGRTPIRAKDSPGFIANRLARPFSLESLRMLDEGVADAPTIDRVVRIGGGFRMGPFELIDLIGLDVNLSVARSFYNQGGEPERWRPSAIQEKMVGEGLLGRKGGRGFYEYGDGPHREPDPRPGDRCADARPCRTGEDRPCRGGDPPPPVRADRQRDGLRARRGDRLTGRYGHRDAPRLQLATRAARADRAGRRRESHRPAGRAARVQRRRLPTRTATPRNRQMTDR